MSFALSWPPDEEVTAAVPQTKASKGKPRGMKATEHSEPNAVQYLVSLLNGTLLAQIENE